MKNKVSILYSWFVRTATYFLPNTPYLMRFRGWLYSLLMKNCGRNFQVFSNAYLNSLNGIEIGDNVYIGPNTVLIGHEITIKSNVLIGPNCVITSSNHQFNGFNFRDKKSTNTKVVIEKGSWIAGNCTILPNTIVPESSIIAAGSVLTKRMLEKKSLYGGVPARKIKNL